MNRHHRADGARLVLVHHLNVSEAVGFAGVTLASWVKWRFQDVRVSFFFFQDDFAPWVSNKCGSGSSYSRWPDAVELVAAQGDADEDVDGMADAHNVEEGDNNENCEKVKNEENLK